MEKAGRQCDTGAARGCVRGVREASRNFAGASNASCSVSNASGTVDANANDVTNADVACTATASVTGTVSGLASGTSVTLVNGSLSLAVASNGAFAFPGVLPAGSAYAVVVGVQPAGQVCTVSNGTGTVVSGTATGIVVTCV